MRSPPKAAEVAVLLWNSEQALCVHMGVDLHEIFHRYSRINYNEFRWSLNFSSKLVAPVPSLLLFYSTSPETSAHVNFDILKRTKSIIFTIWRYINRVLMFLSLPLFMKLIIRFHLRHQCKCDPPSVQCTSFTSAPFMSSCEMSACWKWTWHPAEKMSLSRHISLTSDVRPLHFAHCPHWNMVTLIKYI